MFTPIHRALGLGPGNISIILFKQAVKHGVEKISNLDWKQAAYDSRKPRWDEEAAKDIAAMANSGGGWIVFGVEEDGGKNTVPETVPISWSATDQQRILRAAYAKIGPPVVGLEFYEVPHGNEGGGSVVMMRVPDSANAPHFAKEGDDVFVAPYHNGPHTVYMSDREIERGFRKRFQYADDQERLLQDRYERACEALCPEDGVFLALAAAPHEVATGRVPTTIDLIHQYANAPIAPELVSGTRVDNWWNGGRVRKGFRQWIIRGYQSSRGYFRKFLHDDAAVVGAYQLELLVTDPRWSDRYPVGMTNHCRGSEVEAAVTDFTTLLRSHAKERQAHGGFRIRAGLVGTQKKPIYIHGMSLGNSLLDTEYTEPIVRFQPIAMELDLLLTIDEVLPVINGLTLDLINQGGVQYLQVIAEPNDQQSEPE